MIVGNKAIGHNIAGEHMDNDPKLPKPFLKRDMIKALTRRSHLTNTEAEECLYELLGDIQEALIEGRMVYLTGTGRLVVDRYEQQIYYSRSRKKLLSTQPKRKVHFIPSNRFNDDMQKRTNLAKYPVPEGQTQEFINNVVADKDLVEIVRTMCERTKKFKKQ